MDDAPAGGTLDYAWRRGGQRPLTLPEHVAFAGERALSVVLEIRRGPIDIGRLDLVGGEVVHAELPGSAGDLALRLLGRLGAVEIEVAPRGDEGPRTVAVGGGGSVPAASLDADARQQLVAAYAPLLASVTAGGRRPRPEGSAATKRGAARRSGAPSRRSEPSPQASRPPDTSSTSSPSASSSARGGPTSAAAGEDFNAVFVEATRAYARRDYRGALERFELCARLRPDDARVTHNIDRLRRRLGEL